MSDPTAAAALTLLDPHRRATSPDAGAPAPGHLQSHSAASGSSAPPLSLARDYRKGNWTVHETLVLIDAKRLDDDRRADLTATGRLARSAEQRWKWVENYCWKNGCLRSQNQCNDKWDNLLRDYKKVRDHAAATSDGGGAGRALRTYWSMERHERKEHNLPTNLAPEVFEALTDVLTRRASRRVASTHPPPPLALPPPPPPPLPVSGEEVTVSPETSDSSEGKPRVKRRRLAASVERAAAVVAQAIAACEEKRERRHRELVELEERRLRLEEARNEVRRQGFAGLISAVNALSGVIHSLAGDHRSGESGSH